MSAPLALVESSAEAQAAVRDLLFADAFDNALTVGALAVVVAADVERRDRPAARQDFELLHLAANAVASDLKQLGGEKDEEVAVAFDEAADSRAAARREARARALMRDARTPELRAHVRLVYPGLFASEPDPRPRRKQPARTNIQYPEGFHRWPLGKRNEWWAEASRLYTAVQKERRS